ncbi:MAG: AvaI/BsoBI family type II restriction endonuclease [Planctomycetota bacterium]
MAQARAKTKEAAPFIEEARELWRSLKKISQIHEVAHQEDLRDEIAAAAGLSDKAQSHLDEHELERALEEILDEIASRAHDEWREEIVFRYLLTKGDSLGGRMRNIAGAFGPERFTNEILAQLGNRGKQPKTKASTKGKIKSISWGNRTLLFDKKPSFIGNSIDVILLNIDGDGESLEKPLENPELFVACGELKSGIDPAGADEHWKTANCALDRIRRCFGRSKRPALFFLGSAIEHSMAKEIFAQLRNGRLDCAANFTVPEQVAGLVSWLVDL